MMKRPTALVFPLAFCAAVFAGHYTVTHSGPTSAANDDSTPSAAQNRRIAPEWPELPTYGRAPSDTSGDADSSASTPLSQAWLAAHEREEKDGKSMQSGQTAETFERYSHLSTDDLIASLPDKYRETARNYRRELNTFDPGKRRFVCWSPGSDTSVVAAFRRIEEEGGLAPGETRLQAFQYELDNHWETTATDGGGNQEQGLAVTLTWGIVPDGTLAPDLDGFLGGSDFRNWMAGLVGGDDTGDADLQPWFRMVEIAFERIGRENGINFVYEPNDDGADYDPANVGELGVRPDIRIAARPMDGDSGVLAFAYFPDFGDLVFDSDDDYYANIGSDLEAFIQVLTHEIGHTLGLDHVCPINETKLMEPFVSDAYIGPQFDDYFSLSRFYGDPAEVHSGVRDNDTPGQATPITLLPSVQSTEWLSIDDDEDVDYFIFSSPAGRKVSFRVAPPVLLGGGYLEGEQNFVTGDPFEGFCTDGDPFNPSLQHDLVLELLADDGVTVLAEASTNPIGDDEQINRFELPGAGDYFVRVTGVGGGDTAQTYTFQSFYEFADDSPGLLVDSVTIVDESNVPNNGAADPGETVDIEVVVTNVGAVDATMVDALLSGPAGFTGFIVSEDDVTIPTGESYTYTFRFAQDGTCGEVVQLDLSLTAPGDLDFSTMLPLHLGEETTSTVIGADFEGSDDLPPGWTSTTTGAGTGWSVITTSRDVDTGLRAVHAGSRAAVGESILTSPETTVEPGSELYFRHKYHLETGYDGGVIEFSLNGGDWGDLITLLPAEGTIYEGDYPKLPSGEYETITANPDYQSPIAGRAAYTGNSREFITTRIGLPSTWEGQAIRFRWLLGDEITFRRPGWAIDNIDVSIPDPTCVEFSPGLSLVTDDTEVTEGGPGATASLTTPLPLGQDVTVTLEVGGDAEAADVSSPLTLTLLAGETKLDFPIEVVDDLVAEGTETLILSIPDSEPGFSPLEPSSITLNIIDGVSGYPTWATGGEPFDGDANGDGVQDGIAWLLGAADPSTNAIDLLPTVTESGGDLILTFSCLPIADRVGSILELQHSSDLGVGDPWVGVEVPDSSGGPTSGITFSVTPGVGGLNDVVATIDSGEGSGGRLFGRLEGTE